LRSMDLSIDTIVDGATYTNYTRFLVYGGNTTWLRNGAEMVTTGLGGTTLGIQSGNSSRLIVGSATGVSGWTADGITHEEWYSVARGDTEVIVSTNGYVKLTNVSPYPMYTTGSYVTVSGTAAWRVQDNSMITLRGGTIVMNTNSVLGLCDNNANTSPGFSTEAGTAILRGYGTISNYNAGANFRVLNHGVIRPGDIGVESGVISSNIVGFGTIQLIGGDLLMTNALSYVGSAIYFDFSDTALDQINISGGSALITGGSNIFTLAAGSPPLGPYKYGLGTYDFITGTNVVWSPEYANLTNILGAAGLVQNLDYRFGVMGIGGGLQALRLEFVPEPSTVILLLGGGLVLWRFRRRKS